MTPNKKAFTIEIANIVNNICTAVFNIASDVHFQQVFGLTKLQMEEVLSRLVDVVPDNVFDHGPLTEEIKNIIAREFIFFQIQERWNQTHYQDDLTNFISIFSRDIKQRIETYKTQQLREVR